MAYLGAYAQLPPMTPAQLLKAQQAQAAGHAAATDPLIEPKYTANVLVTTGSSPSTPSASQPYGNGNVWGTATPLQPAPNLSLIHIYIGCVFVLTSLVRCGRNWGGTRGVRTCCAIGRWSCCTRLDARMG